MSFKDSCITQLTPFSLTEESTRVPESNFPVYIGSGNTVMSVDSSGLQSLNHGVQQAFGCMPHAGDMYVVSHGMISDHIDPMNVLPYGYFTWNMDLEGIQVTPDNLVKTTSNFTRKLFLDQGRVVTKLLIGLAATVELDLCMPLTQNCIILKLRVKGYDYENKPVSPARTGRMSINFHLLSREGKKLYDEAAFSDSGLTVSVRGLEDYQYTIKTDTDTQADFHFADGIFSADFDIEAGNTEKEYTFLYDFAGKLGVSDIPMLWEQNVALRKEEYKQLASFEGLDQEEEFLYHNTQYLLMSGFDFTKGLPIGTPFYFPWCWKASTFWDSHFVMDGLMRIGGRKQADAFLKFLFNAMKPEGKPFSWMFNYKAVSTVDDEHDIAPLVLCAHAMTAIKHYEYFRDQKMLKEIIYPIVKRVSEYAAAHLYSKEDGQWILSMPVSNDVVEDEAQEINQTFTTLWFLVIFKKLLAFQNILGLEQDSLLQDIVNNHRIEQDACEYYHCKDQTAQECKWASWIPFLCYPTEAMPFLDMELFDKTRKKYSFENLYMEKQGSYQPWTEFMQANSDFRRGAVEEGFRLRQLGMSHVFGAGFFSEIGPRQQTCGLPPYISAHGTFLSSLVYQFIGTSIWNNEIQIFANMPKYYESRHLKLTNIICRAVKIVKAEITSDRTEVILESAGERENIQLCIKAPSAVSPEQIKAEVNGCKVPFLYDREKHTVILKITSTEKAEMTIHVY